jgi:hypothetical protein
MWLAKSRSEPIGQCDCPPVELPENSRALPDQEVLATFMTLMPQMIVSYSDAAALMLANLDRGNAMARHRVGLALPLGREGNKRQWTATPRSSE